ncbi:MAG: hypothetical protein QOE92_1166, partial [Chloroflexota bacterium]|nr:hypothetical protein [Chloroflexota bacterium]
MLGGGRGGPAVSTGRGGGRPAPGEQESGDQPAPRDGGARAAVGAVLALALAALAFFDLGPPLAFNDDWVYSWS